LLESGGHHSERVLRRRIQREDVPNVEGIEPLGRLKQDGHVGEHVIPDEELVLHHLESDEIHRRFGLRQHDANLDGLFARRQLESELGIAHPSVWVLLASSGSVGVPFERNGHSVLPIDELLDDERLLSVDDDLETATNMVRLAIRQ